jgi:AraC-like DNA-binding protein
MYTEFKPDRLSNLVNTIWFSNSDIDQEVGHIAPPSLGSQIVIKIYQSYAETVLSGPATQQKKYPHITGANYFGIEFSPLVGPIFDEIQLKDLKDSSVQINKVMGIDLPLLADQLQSLSGWSKQKLLIEQTVCQNYPENGRHLNQNILQAADIARNTNGNITIKALSATVGLSRRQLERLFLRHTGLSPKTFCATLRLKRVRDILQIDPAISLAYLAHDCGYTDQAHLANDFRRAMGASIGTYMNLRKG